MLGASSYVRTRVRTQRIDWPAGHMRSRISGKRLQRYLQTAGGIRQNGLPGCSSARQIARRASVALVDGPAGTDTPAERDAGTRAANAALIRGCACQDNSVHLEPHLRIIVGGCHLANNWLHRLFSASGKTGYPGKSRIHWPRAFERSGIGLCAVTEGIA